LAARAAARARSISLWFPRVMLNLFLSLFLIRLVAFVEIGRVVMKRTKGCFFSSVPCAAAAVAVAAAAAARGAAR